MLYLLAIVQGSRAADGIETQSIHMYVCSLVAPRRWDRVNPIAIDLCEITESAKFLVNKYSALYDIFALPVRNPAGFLLDGHTPHFYSASHVVFQPAVSHCDMMNKHCVYFTVITSFALTKNERFLGGKKTKAADS